MGTDKDRGNLMAVGFGLLLSILILVSIEGVCFLLNQSSWATLIPWRNQVLTSYEDEKASQSPYALAVDWSWRQIVNPHPQYDYHDSSKVNYSQKYENGFFDARFAMFSPNMKSRSLVTHAETGEVVYDTIYTSDSVGRRIVPGQDQPGRDLHIILLGGSITLGEGVNDHETLAAQMAKQTTRHKVYNLGTPGSSPSRFVHRIEANKLWNDIPQKEGLAIYVFFDNHLSRVFGSMETLATWGDELPYVYENNEGIFVGSGTFKSGRPYLTSLYRFLGNLNFTEFFKIQWPPRWTDQHYASFARLVNQVRNSYLSELPGQKFYFVFYPGGYSNSAPLLAPHLEQLQIPYLNYHLFEMDRYTQEPTTLPYDGHPTAVAHRLLAEQISRDLHITTMAPSDRDLAARGRN